MSTDEDKPDDETQTDEENSIDTPDFAEDEEITRDVPIERKNTLQRIREDYDEPWKGSIREALQNGGDAFGRNKHYGVLPENAELFIEIRIDTERNTLTYEDNAGGMTRETLEDNLLGIDTPDEDKEAGGGAGAYGRGFYVVSMCGEGKTYVETRQGEEHHASTVTNIGKYSEPKTPENSKLPEGVQGTYIHVADVLDHDMEHLSTWEQIKQVLLGSFTFLLLRDDVTVEYTIDGETHQAEPPDLEKYLEEGQLIYKEKLPEFSAEGNSYQIHDLYVIRTDVMDEDPPWEGVAMLKGNKYLDHPFMAVKTYKPTGIPSLRRPPQMIGWCDASELCPELENNSHTSFRGNETDSGIKEVLMELHKEHFKKGRTTEERQQLATDITSSINELLTEYDDFDEYQVQDGTLTNAGGDDDDGPSEDTPTSPPTPSLLKCQVGKRKFDVGETVTLRTQVENPADSEHERFEIYDIKVASNDLGMNKSIPSRLVDVPKNEHDTFDIQAFRPTEEGIYSFSARIRGQPEVMEMDEEEPDELDHSRVTFYVGDVLPRSREKEKGDDGGGDEPTRISIVRETSFFPGDDESWKAVASERGDGGIDLTINVNRQEWLAATRITDDDNRRDQIQKRLGTEWGVEEVILHRNIDEIHDLLGDMMVDGENAAELLEEGLTRRAEILARMEAAITEQLGVEYES
ncbi:hypothetical protein E6P09_02935 [Haloferax mediterranei ATCC 33500]|uniref:Uncharacterized protein n=1 Tax=Haloferax mediterranei (strain ATCC 33500 / DSM 1411 / JCM 8866 / NBRC 14739 / NCIMB 2177 / R-4) TaxID=523841 RepID=I3R8V4_HALMT|nr:hypothetical protein [Haloferax mediterranei]AFK20664.1 hypothetical protein HFX_3000 [Haloferax mediterranei ATCC 33500]AHZ22852.1 hypothetical protein BM92_09465 [Haloferax mediterranei ATCC 33500]EMA03016.1 hypothetical protein C439_10545 [Haloferax mediterranei ATCC 33500]MDX5987803.1 hypothetical protein [Haloferax mediterranei ATCC 33500]QCQ74279.1 hypothetical protein E6P09_02935 [Haloferax mediterranei ATCC 33500]